MWRPGRCVPPADRDPPSPPCGPRCPGFLDSAYLVALLCLHGTPVGWMVLLAWLLLLVFLSLARPAAWFCLGWVGLSVYLLRQTVAFLDWVHASPPAVRRRGSLPQPRPATWVPLWLRGPFRHPLCSRGPFLGEGAFVATLTSLVVYLPSVRLATVVLL